MLTVILIWQFGERVNIATLTYAIIDPFIAVIGVAICP